MKKNNTVAKNPKREGKRGKSSKGWITIGIDLGVKQAAVAPPRLIAALDQVGWRQTNFASH